jgi:hypothetical protein
MRWPCHGTKALKTIRDRDSVIQDAHNTLDEYFPGFPATATLHDKITHIIRKLVEYEHDEIDWDED